MTTKNSNLVKERGEMYSLYQRYLWSIDVSDKHNVGSPQAMMDVRIRNFIKSDNIHVSMLSHNAIINREMPEQICRVCMTGLDSIFKSRIGVYNDYLVLRHPQCVNPICFNCAKNNPDKFYKAFVFGVDMYEKTGGLNYHFKKYAKQK